MISFLRLYYSWFLESFVWNTNMVIKQQHQEPNHNYSFIELDVIETVNDKPRPTEFQAN